MTEFQKRLHELMTKFVNEDVPIWKMYGYTYFAKDDEHVFDESSSDRNRYMQQRLAPIVQRLNSKLPAGHKIEPGQLKRTYRLNTNAQANA